MRWWETVAFCDAPLHLFLSQQIDSGPVILTGTRHHCHAVACPCAEPPPVLFDCRSMIDHPQSRQRRRRRNVIKPEHSWDQLDNMTLLPPLVTPGAIPEIRRQATTAIANFLLFFPSSSPRADTCQGLPKVTFPQQ
jgi:hypothetical protein